MTPRRFMDSHLSVQAHKEGAVKKARRTRRNFVKKHLDRLHKPATHVDKKKREQARKCRGRVV